MIANIILDSLTKVIGNSIIIIKYPSIKNSVKIIRYVDDFIII
jgi:hypothetical protein